MEDSQRKLKFSGPQTAILCPTAEEAEKVTAMAQAAGFKRKDGIEWNEKPTPGGFAYCISEGEFSAPNNYEVKGYSVIPAVRFIQENFAEFG